MPIYNVTIPVSFELCFSVEAASIDEADNKARSMAAGGAVEALEAKNLTSSAIEAAATGDLYEIAGYCEGCDAVCYYYYDKDGRTCSNFAGDGEGIYLCTPCCNVPETA